MSARAISLRRAQSLPLKSRSPPRPFSASCRRLTSDDSPTFAENDAVILRSVTNPAAVPYLIPKLTPERQFQSHRGALLHDQIIGLRERDTVRTTSGSKYRVSQPTLSEYITLRTRRVTPIYPHDAELITSLLDLHPPSFSSASPTRPLEILEAGTGHGSLTIHLARAISGFNPPSSSTHPPPRPSANTPAITPPLHLPSADPSSPRRAIIHTLDSLSENSHFARHVIYAFRQALYYPHIDFHVGTLRALLAQPTARDRFAHVLLDLPQPDAHLEAISQAVRVGGLVVVFVPSITQLTECVKRVKKEGLGLVLEKVIELEAGRVREWDVRLVKPRANAARSSEGPAATGEGAEEQAEEGDGRVMVCRPKAGERIMGGGFVGVWRRARDWTDGGEAA